MFIFAVAVVAKMVSALVDGPFAASQGVARGSGARVALLLNNAGATPWLHALVCVRAGPAMERSEEAKFLCACMHTK